MRSSYVTSSLVPRLPYDPERSSEQQASNAARDCRTKLDQNEMKYGSINMSREPLPREVCA
jgi:hypothetical protein